MSVIDITLILALLGAAAAGFMIGHKLGRRIALDTMQNATTKARTEGELHAWREAAAHLRRALP